MNSSHNTEEHNHRKLHRFIFLSDSFLLNSSNG